MAPWHDVLAADAIESGRAIVVALPDRRILIARTQDGQLWAIDDTCSHDGGPLGEGHVFGHEVECPRHGACFDVRTGEALTLPATQPVRTYPVRVDNGRIWVETP